MTDDTDRAPDAAGSPAGGSRHVRDQLITDNLGLANYLARQFANRGESLDDLQQVAMLALVNAAGRFEPSRDVKFSTYASRTIVGELKHHLRDKSWAVRPPRSLQELALAIPTATSQLTNSLGRSPTVAEIARLLNRRDEEIVIAMEASRGYRATSLDATAADGTTLMSRLESRELEGEEERATGLEQQIAHLAPADQELVRLRFVEELSQAAIAARLGVTQMFVSRRLRIILDEMRGLS